MRYIKTFEDKLIKKYWEVPVTDPEFFVAMNKIGAPKETQKRYFELVVSTKIKESNYLSMFVSYNNSERSVNSKWHWSYPNGTAKGFFTMHYYNFEGVVEVTEEDIENWSEKNAANKFNL